MLEASLKTKIILWYSVSTDQQRLITQIWLGILLLRCKRSNSIWYAAAKSQTNVHTLFGRCRSCVRQSHKEITNRHIDIMPPITSYVVQWEIEFGRDVDFLIRVHSVQTCRQVGNCIAIQDVHVRSDTWGAYWHVLGQHGSVQEHIHPRVRVAQETSQHRI